MGQFGHGSERLEAENEATAHGGALSVQALSDLIGSVYDSALDPSRWERTLADIAAALPCESVILSLNDLRHNRLLIDKSVGWGPSGLEERQKHIPEIHARVSEWFVKGPSLDLPFVASRELSLDYLVTSPYVQTCLKPLGIVDIMHHFLMYTPTHFSELVIGRHERHGPLTDREIAIGTLLLPHLRRAVTISNVLDASTIERTRLAQALDTLRCGVVLTNNEGTILHANSAAEQLFRNGTEIRSIGGVLSAPAPDATQELLKAIRLAARDETTLGRTGLAIRLTSTSAAPLYAHVLPMTGSELRTRLQPDAVAAVFIGGSSVAMLDLTPTETKDYLRRRFGLTNAEANVAVEVLKGGGREAVAAELGVSMTTVRTHLSRIFEKTGVRRQSELVHLLLQGELGENAPG